MSTALAGAVELLDRSLAYTRPALAAIRPEHLPLPTPCDGWPLAVLLAHVDDGLDAWTEAASGRVSLVPGGGGSPLSAIRDKACALLGWWLDHPPDAVAVGDASLPSATLAAVAALEMTLHGWDLHTTLGSPATVPLELAQPLLLVARAVVTPVDRGPCLGRARPAPPGADDATRLLAHLGRG